MANHKSAAKRNRQRIKITARNRAVKSRMRSIIKAAHEAVAEKADGADVAVKTACTMLDKAASKNVLPTQRAARLKSRLESQLHASRTAS
jgi:small subunit ribosomal protein S20